MAVGLHALGFPLSGRVRRHTAEDRHLQEVVIVIFKLNLIMMSLVMMIMIVIMKIVKVNRFNGDDDDNAKAWKYVE